MEYTIADIKFAGSVTTDTIYWVNPGPYSLQVEGVYAVPDAAVSAAADVVVVLSSGASYATALCTVDVSSGLTAGTPTAQTLAAAGDDLVIAPGEALELDKSGAVAFQGGVAVQLRAVRV